MKSGSITGCRYVGDGHPFLQFQESSAAGAFASYRQSLQQANGGEIVEYSGFGDEAFTLTIDADPLQGITLGAREGEWAVFAGAGKVPIEKLRALVADLFADLGV